MTKITDEVIIICRIASCIAADNLKQVNGSIKTFKTCNFDPVKIHETILQSYLFCGFPAAIESMKIFKSYYPEFIFAKSKYDFKRFKSSGIKNCKLIYKNNYKKLIVNMNVLSPDLQEWMIVEGYGKVLSRNGLNLLEREFVNFSILCTRFYVNQLHSHAKGCLNLGASKNDLKIILKENHKTITSLNTRKVLSLLNGL